MSNTTTRQRIVDAAASSLAERGLARTTTKEVARRAHLSEAAIYIHFGSKDDLLRTVVRELLQTEVLGAIPSDDLARPLRDVLIDLVGRMVSAMYEQVPMICAISSDAELARFVREEVVSVNQFQGLAILESYLRSRQRAGALGTNASALMVARMLYGAAFHHAYLLRLFGETQVRPRGRAFVEGLVDAALATAGVP